MNDAYKVVNKIIIGQEHIKKTIAIFMEDMSEGGNNNILITGQSGYGKTFIASVMLNWATSINNLTSTYFLCDEKIKISPMSWGLLLDEIHLINSPEYLYPILDSKKHSIIMCTNEWGLKEPLVNRSFRIMLQPYSVEELAKISKRYLISRGFSGCSDISEEIANRSRGVPRVTKVISEMVLKSHKGNPPCTENIGEFLDSIGIYSEGFKDSDYTYLEQLRSSGGRASLDLLSRLTGQDKNYIVQEVEPFLIKQGKIQITPRGRILNE